MRGIPPIAALIAVILAAATLAACGSSDSSTSSPASNDAPSTDGQGGEKGEDAANGSGEGGSRQAQSNAGESNSHVKTAPLKVSGGGSAQFRDQGGDNSIQEFGEEGEESELEEAAEAVHGYLVARAEEDWATACSYLAETVKSQLNVIASRSSQLKGKGCAEILQTLTPPLPTAVRRESTIVDAASLRLEGERAFLIYRGSEGAEYAMLMEQEDGAWKVGSLSATPLS